MRHCSMLLRPADLYAGFIISLALQEQAKWRRSIQLMYRLLSQAKQLAQLYYTRLLWRHILPAL